MNTGHEYLAMMAEHDQKAWKEAFMEEPNNIALYDDMGEHYKRFLAHPFNTPYDFLSSSFVFARTPQGHEYWMNLSRTI